MIIHQKLPQNKFSGILGKVVINATKIIIKHQSQIKINFVSLEAELVKKMENMRDSFKKHEDWHAKDLYGLYDQMRVLESLFRLAKKKVQNVLDDYSVYLSGFNEIELVQLEKILSILGVTRIASICSQVSHVFVGAENPQLFAELDKADIEPKILKLEWLLKIVKARKFVDQKDYTIDRPSPANKIRTALTPTTPAPNLGPSRNSKRKLESPDDNHLAHKKNRIEDKVRSLR